MQYDRSYFEGRGSTYAPYEDKALTIERNYLPKILERVKLGKGFNVLDIGCAFGYFLKFCDNLGCNTCGIDVSEYAIERAQKETIAKLYVHDVERGLPIFQDNFFDLVTMFDVIEHLANPYNVLRETHRILKPHGRLAITTPNLNAIERFCRKILRNEKMWHGFVDEAHLYLFTMMSLRFLVERAKFKIVNLETPFHPLPKIVQRMSNKTGLGGQIWLLAEKTR
jgi:2-polyprenyl-3-methyl-5-hydroxy-6-metoxy-1,4-benzoquinol methylase